MSNLTRIQEVAQKVIDPATLPQNRGYGISKMAVGVAQNKVLQALGITANNFKHADVIFDALGITVSSKRGTPSVTRKTVSAVSQYGEGEETYQEKFDFSAISQWM
jgi:hypothetical protein